MRTQMLCALVFLCGAEVATAQMPNANNGYYQYGPAPQAPPVYNGYYGAPQMAAPQQNPYVQGGVYPNNAPNPQRPATMSAMPTSMAKTDPTNAGPVAGKPSTTDAQSMRSIDTVASTPEQYFDDPNAHYRSMGSVYEKPVNNHVWFGADYTTSWFKSERLNTPLVTTGSVLDPHTAALGQPGTGVLFGDHINPGVYSGIKGEAGIFIDNDGKFSIDVAGMYTFQNSTQYSLSSDTLGNPIIARPIFNVLSGTQSSFVDSLPGVAAGGVAVDFQSELWGGEINAAYHVCCSDHLSFQGLGGFRYLRLSESLRIEDRLSPLNPNALTFQGAFVPTGQTISDFDRFATANNFYGLQLGGRLRWEEQWFFVSAFGKIALGANDENVDISGSSQINPSTGLRTASGGILALPSNIGNHNQTTFGVIPEVGLNMGVNITPHLAFTAGYSFLNWNQVVRPGDQINPAVNPNTVPTSGGFGQATGPAAPIFHVGQESFFVHSLNFGLELHY